MIIGIGVDIVLPCIGYTSTRDEATIKIIRMRAGWLALGGGCDESN
jgi:hypothetical protein